MHILQPKHSKITGTSEAKELFQKYNLSSNQLPKIKITDPALPQGCKIGDIIKIEYKNEKIKSFFYRIVVE